MVHKHQKMKAYLVQRGQIADRDFKKGIDSICKFDYMGSAEFEFGALGESLGRIRKDISNYKYMNAKIYGIQITVFFNKKHEESEIETYLKDLADNKFHVKQHSDFNNVVNPSKFEREWQAKHPNKTNFWWDIENDFMFWISNQLFQQKFKNIIQLAPLQAKIESDPISDGLQDIIFNIKK